ncbi:DUF4231 domain-containing protein [Rheinheimera sp. FR7-31]|uniref:SLATT domain-containing protein n=1 Tax=Rheinheimera fenheensis TaxID=3152295 RepID=UPI00325F65F0
MKMSYIEDKFYLQIQSEIDKVEKKSDEYRFYYYAIRIFTLLLSGVITILSGLNLGYYKPFEPSLIQNLILVFGASATVLNGVDTLFQFEKKGSTYKLMLNELRSLRSEIVFHFIKNKDSNKKLDEKTLEDLFSKYKTIKQYSNNLLEKESK